MEFRIAYPNELYHHGIKGQKWGVRRYQRPDGTLTSPHTGRFMSGNDGRSGHSINDRMVDNIERMYDNAGTEHERAEIQDVINYIRRKGMNT